MDYVIKNCERWTEYDIERLKLFIETCNGLKTISSSDLAKDSRLRPFINTARQAENEACGLCSRRHKLVQLRFLYFWMHVLSSEYTDSIDITCLRNEIEVFLDVISAEPIESECESELEFNNVK